MHARTLHSILLGAVAACFSACDGTTVHAKAAGLKSSNLTSGATVDTDAAFLFDDSGAPFSRPFNCAAPEATKAYEELRIAIGVDYLEVRHGTPAAAPDAVGFTWTVEKRTGRRCAGATGRNCEVALSAVTTENFLFGDCGLCINPGGYYLAYTKGDDAGRISTIAELVNVAGAIDSAAAAWMVAQAEGYSVLCGEDWVAPHPDGIVLRARFSISLCPIQTKTVLLLVRPDGTTEELFSDLDPVTNSCVGRRPQGLFAQKGGTRKNATSIVGRHFAEIARLEAASVTAFCILRSELAAHRAPRSLIVAAERAARDEIRHARAMAKIACRYGTEVERPHVKRTAPRALLDIAIENAVEGCVRETYGALEGLFQSQMAGDPQIRAVMRDVAVDETRHGALSWRVAEWLESKLTPAERRRVQNARASEIQALLRRVQIAPHHELVSVAGVPSAAQASFLAEALRTTLWMS